MRIFNKKYLLAFCTVYAAFTVYIRILELQIITYLTMAKTVKDTLYLEEGSFNDVQALVAAGKTDKQRFYNIAIQKEVEARKQEEKLLEQLKEVAK